MDGAGDAVVEFGIQLGQLVAVEDERDETQQLLQYLRTITTFQFSD